jgi:methyl-accepting chemotaxis protein
VSKEASFYEMNAEELRVYTENKLADILSVLADVALGDLSVEAMVDSEDIFGSLALGINAMIQGLRELKTPTQREVDK